VKQVLISAVVAAIVVAAALHLDERFDEAAEVPAATSGAAAAPFSLRVTDELIEDGWVDGARTPGADRKPLEHAGSSVCFLTKIELEGIRGPEDANACRIEVDDFTGFWELIVEVEEGGQSAVRCNARCLVWAQEPTE
jgi:hypothetical protein